MPRTIKVKLIRNEFPATYRYSLWLRIFKLLFAFAVCLYAFYFVVKFVSAETPMFFKVLPLIILFIALDGMFKQLMALNRVTFYEDRVCFGFIAKPRLIIPYENILYIDLVKQITYSIILKYKEGNREKIFKTSASFPKILEIILNLADLAPNAQSSEFFGKIIKHLRTLAGENDAEQV